MIKIQPWVRKLGQLGPMNKLSSFYVNSFGQDESRKYFKTDLSSASKETARKRILWRHVNSCENNNFHYQILCGPKQTHVVIKAQINESIFVRTHMSTTPIYLFKSISFWLLTYVNRFICSEISIARKSKFFGLDTKRMNVVLLSLLFGLIKH